jgi:flagellar biosynthesis protein FlhF
MKTVKLLAESPQDAVRKARQLYGPQAIVQEVRQHTAKGLSRMWRKSKLELILQVPDPKTEEPQVEATQDAVEEPVVKPFFQIYQDQVQPQSQPQGKVQVQSEPLPGSATAVKAMANRTGVNKWRVEPMLRSMGLSDYLIAEILDRLSMRFQNGIPDFVRDELAFCRSLMMEMLPHPTEDPREGNRPVVLLGTPGCGKTTVLCKWMAHLVFHRNQTPVVWRLDGAVPNTAEALEVYAEMLNAPISRFPQYHEPGGQEAPLFIDLPGVSVHDPRQMSELGSQLAELPDCDRYLVLNACYTAENLNEQIKAFERFQPKGLIFSHLDEESHWGRLMNLFIGTNCPVALMSGGQNIPGTFEVFRPSGVLSRVFPSNVAA